MEENNSSQTKVQELWMYAIIVFLVIVLIFSFGKINAFDEPIVKSKEELEREKYLINLKHLRIQKVLEKKLWLKKKLDKASKRILFAVRLFIVISIVLIFGLMLKFGVEFLNAVGYLAAGGIGLSLITFLIIGSPKSVIELWEMLKKKIEIRIYKKYIDLDLRIEKDKQIKIELEKSREEIEKVINSFDGIDTD